MTLSDGTQVMPGELSILTPVCECGEASSETEILLTIREGKFHQVKRMFEALGCQVVFLKRLSMGSLRLDESLRPGEFRKLTEEELEGLKEGSEKADHPDLDYEQKETGQKIPELLKGKEAVILIWTVHWWIPCGCGSRLILSIWEDLDTNVLRSCRKKSKE